MMGGGSAIVHDGAKTMAAIKYLLSNFTTITHRSILLRILLLYSTVLSHITDIAIPGCHTSQTIAIT